MALAASSSGNVIPFPATSVQAHYYQLPAGDSGVRRAIVWMGKLAGGVDGALNPQIRQLALQIVQGAPARDDSAQASAIFGWVKKNIEFRGEPDEVLQSPVVTLKFHAGDCDDHATLLAALLRAIGIRAQFVTVAADPSAPDVFTHVYAQAWIRARRQWLALDTTVGRSYPGWRPERISRIQSWAALPGLKTLGDGDIAPTPRAVSQAAQIINAAAPITSQVLREVRNKPGVSFQYGQHTGYLDLNGINARDLIVGAAAVFGILALVSGGRRRA